MNKKVNTVKLQGGADYAHVADRLKEFRQDCPNGLIETKPLISDGNIMFTVRILKDKSKPESAEATGHAMNKLGSAKVFEKTETQALGRALALLGYLASGEIASAEEMEEFYTYKAEQEAAAIQLAIESIEDAKTIDELKQIFISLGTLINNEKVVKAKDKRKTELQKVETDESR